MINPLGTRRRRIHDGDMMDVGGMRVEFTSDDDPIIRFELNGIDVD